MRPQVLYPLFASVDSLPGVGPRMRQHLEKLSGARVIDLLWHLPSGVIDRRYKPHVADALVEEVATLTVRIDRHVPPSGRQPYRIECSDDTGTLNLVYFNANPDYLLSQFPEGETRVVSGTVQEFRNRKQIAHPDRSGTLDDLDEICTVEAVYPLTAGLTLRTVARTVEEALSRLPDLPEWLDRSRLDELGWSGWRQSMIQAHNPENALDTLFDAKARVRLAYDELLARELAILLTRNMERQRSGRSIKGTGELRQALTERLPFTFTGAQQVAIEEITADMASDRRMLRILQGDVGSGKTVVALMALLSAVENGFQAALMAPTDLLARQHFATIKSMLDGMNVRIALFTGREKGKQRRDELERLASGEIDIAIGTHAIFQSGVLFKDLAICVIDEQQRFGVQQRLALTDKGLLPDVIIMTATPIPRTLMMAVYGDLDTSRLTERPPGRTPVETRAMPVTRIEEVVERLVAATEDGAKAYWLCPAVEESETTDLAAATQRHAFLTRRFGDRAGLIHGRLSDAEKEALMTRFAEGDLDVLVATTVIEVGIDVAAASIMVIEHAEFFGLSQLHQLRGRVGRGSRQSYCLLLYAPPLTDTARRRLQVLREIDDGFVIAEEDLRLRGSGERLGARQSGWPRFRLADLAVHSDLAMAARAEAEQILADDPRLEREDKEAIHLLLSLFERDAEVAAAVSD